MRRALFGGGVSSASAVTQPAGTKQKASQMSKLTSKTRVTLSVSNVFEGATESVIFESDSLSRLAAEMDAKKKF
ncbi:MULTISPECIES: hypothetical protein [unclassified Pseudomonas]|uniref:hypothetical protein n=1 Tax=unclassified Pseudomonas TaxID=196821 RepID=UPI0009EB99FC|nr:MULTISPECIES: hypothetical protein [unclassified Pseudomonas]MCE0782287.1 hypothetical protein [Pseudomonas sp. NMI542_15]